jgi:hypothetical protein
MQTAAHLSPRAAVFFCAEAFLGQTRIATGCGAFGACHIYDLA